MNPYDDVFDPFIGLRLQATTYRLMAGLRDFASGLGAEDREGLTRVVRRVLAGIGGVLEDRAGSLEQLLGEVWE